MTVQATEQQREVIAAVASGEGADMLVRARAGTGKTWTLLQAIAARPRGKSAILCAFNLDIAKELRRKAPPNVIARTLHGLGREAINGRFRGVTIDRHRERRQAGEVCGPDEPGLVLDAVSDLACAAKEQAPSEATNHDIMRKVGMRLGILPSGEELADTGWSQAGVIRAAAMVVERATDLKADPCISFPDMLYLPLVMRLPTLRADIVVVDELQDLGLAQIQLSTRLRAHGARFMGLGDDRQCQPPGTMVRLHDGVDVPIETLQPGARVKTYDRRSSVALSGIVTEIAERHYGSSLYTVSAGGLSSNCTDSHRWIVRWANKSEHVWVTYIMRKGTRFRVGRCRLFRRRPSSSAGLNFGLSERARVERADAAWILRVHETLGEALAYEQILSVRYSIPEIVFHEPSGIKYFTQEIIESVFNELGDLTLNAARCLADHGRSIDYPLYQSASTSVGQRKRGLGMMHEVEACNLIPEYMAIPRHDNGPTVSWHPISSIDLVPYDGPVYSLDVTKHHNYVADGLVTCNSIYSWRGAFPDALDRIRNGLKAREYKLTVTHRCARLIVEQAQSIVPDIEAAAGAPDGIVRSCAWKDLATSAQPGDFVIGRTNAILVLACLRMLRAGTRARVVGSDLAPTMSALVRRLARGTGGDMVRMAEKIAAWIDREVRTARARQNDQAEALAKDKGAVLDAILDDCDTIDEMIQRIRDLFDDDGTTGHVVCSTVHKAKGLEADRVWMLTTSFTPPRADDSPTEVIEAANLRYVTMTRARHELIYVQD